MKDPIRVVLVDPIEETRQSIQRLLGTMGDLWLAEICGPYPTGAKRVAEILPDLVIVALDADPEKAIELIQTVVKNHPNVAVLPASRGHDSAIILKTIRAGAREFLTLPAAADEVREAVGRLIEHRGDAPQPAVARGPQVITVTGAAGGVGCTSLAINLGTILASSSPHEIVLADLDLMLGSVDACLDLVPDRSLHDVVQNIDRLDQTLLKRSLTRHMPSGLFILPHPIAMDEAAKIDPEALRRVITMLKASFASVVLDTSKGLQSTDFVAFEMADIILMVVQLDLTCLRNTARLLKLFEEFEGLSDRVRLVINRIGSHESEISLKKVEETLKKPISWTVPNMTKVFHTARARGVAIDAVAPGCRAHQALLEISRAVRPFPITEEVKPRRGLFAAFF